MITNYSTTVPYDISATVFISRGVIEVRVIRPTIGTSLPLDIFPEVINYPTFTFVSKGTKPPKNWKWFDTLRTPLEFPKLIIFNRYKPKARPIIQHVSRVQKNSWKRKKFIQSL